MTATGTVAVTDSLAWSQTTGTVIGWSCSMCFVYNYVLKSTVAVLITYST